MCLSSNYHIKTASECTMSYCESFFWKVDDAAPGASPNLDSPTVVLVQTRDRWLNNIVDFSNAGFAFIFIRVNCPYDVILCVSKAESLAMHHMLPYLKGLHLTADKPPTWWIVLRRRPRRGHGKTLRCICSPTISSLRACTDEDRRSRASLAISGVEDGIEASLRRSTVR